MYASSGIADLESPSARLLGSTSSYFHNLVSAVAIHTKMIFISKRTDYYER